MIDHRQLWTLILAAGGSNRLGHAKQLVKIHGQTLIQKCIEQVKNLNNNHFSIVLGAQAEQIKQVISEHQTQILMNPDWLKGLSSSIKFGIKAIPEHFDILIILCDQYRIDQSDLNRLHSAWLQHPESLIAAQYENTIGVPAIIPQKYRQQLLQLNGNQGAKVILTKHQQNLIPIPIKNAAFDLDTQEDLKNLRKEFKANS